MRLILSIITGILVGSVLATATDHVFHITQVYPPYGEPMFDAGLLFLALAYRAVFTILAGYITAMLARGKAKKAVLILGIINAIAWLGGTIALWEYATPWYNIAGIVTAIPLCLLGGRLSWGRQQVPLGKGCLGGKSEAEPFKEHNP